MYTMGYYSVINKNKNNAICSNMDGTRDSHELIEVSQKEKDKYHMRHSHCGSVETNLTSIHEETGSNPALALWVKDLVLLRAVVEVASAAWISHCCDCGIGQQL